MRTVESSLSTPSIDITSGVVKGDSKKHLDAAAEALKEAASLWNESGASYGLTGVLAAQALLGASESNPTVAALWNKERRTLSDAALIARALKTDAAGAAAALSPQPAMKALIPILEEDKERPGALAVVVSKIAQTPTLIAAAEKARTRQTATLNLEIAALLDPEDPDVKERQMIFDAAAAKP